MNTIDEVFVEYHLITPALGVAEMVIGPVPQREAGLVDVTVGRIFTVATTGVRVVLAQPL